MLPRPGPAGGGETDSKGGHRGAGPEGPARRSQQPCEQRPGLKAAASRRPALFWPLISSYFHVMSGDLL